MIGEPALEGPGSYGAASGAARCQTKVREASDEYKKLSAKKVTPSRLWHTTAGLGEVHVSPFTPGRDVETLQQKFGNIIRRRRTDIGLGQEALADKAGLHRTHVSLLERGKRMPSLEVVRKLAAALETSMASLMTDLEARGAADSPDRAAASETSRPKRGRPKKPA